MKELYSGSNAEFIVAPRWASYTVVVTRERKLGLNEAQRKYFKNSSPK